MNRRWLLVALAFFALLLLANLGRVTLLVLIGQVAGWRLLAQMIHIPLGVIGFVAACGAALVLLRWAGNPAAPKESSPSEEGQPSFAQPAWLAPGLVILIRMALLYSPRPNPVAAATLRTWNFPQELHTNPWSLTQREMDWLTSASTDGTVTASRWRFEAGTLHGSLLLVASDTWCAQHRPERCRQLPHNNLGGVYYLDGRFYMFTGDKAELNSNLTLTVWNHDWTPASEQPSTLMPAPAGGGYFFASGIAFEKVGRRWYLAFHHVLNSNPDATTHIDLAVFDESFQLLAHQHADPGFRPHLLLRDTYLYMVYDLGGVFLRRYDIRGAAVVSQRPTTLLIPSARNDEGLSTEVSTH